MKLRNFFHHVLVLTFFRRKSKFPDVVRRRPVILRLVVTQLSLHRVGAEQRVRHEGTGKSEKNGDIRKREERARNFTTSSTNNLPSDNLQKIIRTVKRR